MMNKDLAGTWVNSFGSQMSLVIEGTAVRGTYSSHTGSTGSYLLVGSCSVHPPSKELGQSIAMAIYWKNIQDGIKDESWHWAGSMCGQLQLDGKMTLTNSIVVSVPFESYQKGNYIDELVFTKAESARQSELSTLNNGLMDHESDTKAYPVAGKWLSLDDEIALNVYQVDAKTGLTKAILTTANTDVPLLGFIDTDAELDMAQSISLTGYCLVPNETCSISGMLNYGSEHLILYSWMAGPTSPQDSFMQTRLASMTLKRVITE
ncbi:avidin/streptavidin family protein [Vibrio sp. DW001]|uniref:avidin/streptavidin family protein n=1 Tax=Vibrio sp. DW001 TaxID=2912315 RepID=UPI0023B07FCA|nr:avidin/streptavidin family protein [Vibrio sp. DW001]WED27286.1 avidin/streptavidin family protein [Vibrio sp. DW001]